MRDRKKSFTFGFLIFIFGFLLGWSSKTTLAPTIATVTLTPTSTSYVGNYQVRRIIDGDTIQLENGEKVRYIGIDTPETVDPRKPVQCFGQEASKKNKELVEGKIVRLEKDVSDKDKYGRLLRYVWVGETFVNLELVKFGFAHSSTFPPDIKYQKEFQQAENEARAGNLGLWSICQIFKPPTP